MKVALVNTPFVNLYGPIKLSAGRYFPLGLGYISSFLKQYGHNVRIYDPEATGADMNLLRKELSDFNPGLVGITSATPNFQNAVEIAKMAGEFPSNPRVVLGGVHATALGEEILKRYRCFDFIISGEGELTFRDLLDCMCSGRPRLDDIDGLIYRDGEKITKNRARKWIEDLDSLPYPDRDAVPARFYRPHSYNAVSKSWATVVTGRGCPFKCTFCASYLTTGYKYRTRKSSKIVEEIEYLVNRYDIKQIVFLDDTFTLFKDRVKEICGGIIDRGLDIKWSCFARVNTLDEDTLEIMKKSGCYCLSFGFESGSNDILKKMKKGTTVEECAGVMEKVRKIGLKSLGFFILGAEGETRETINRTIKFARELGPTLAFFNMPVPYPGTELFERYFGKTEVRNWEDFVAVGVNPVMKPEGVTAGEMRNYVIKAYATFYLNPVRIFEILRYLTGPYELLEYFRGGAGLFMQVVKMKLSNAGKRENEED
ncbi:MAG: radical SAM protein [bacterium]|nr:radical SAM protein [bacterium]